MNTRKYMRHIRMCLLLCVCSVMFAGCIPGGDETYVLEEPAVSAADMLDGIWTQTALHVYDEYGDETFTSGILAEFDDFSEIEFDELGDYAVTYPDGVSENGSWSISDDESILYLDGEDWEIYSFGERKLVIVYTYYYRDEYYYVMRVLERVSPTGEEDSGNDGGLQGLGDVSDNNPYKPYGSKELVSKITLTRVYPDVTNKFVYLFEYDKKSRIIDYTVQTYNTITNTVAREEKFNFIYDDDKVRLYHDGELMNTAVMGDNGYISRLYEGDSKEVNTTFIYDSYGFLTGLDVDGSAGGWRPQYDNGGYDRNMTSPYADGSGRLRYESDAMNNTSVDFNGLFTNCYQWEWFMHDYTGVVFGLFDFYGARSYKVATDVSGGSYWTDRMTDWAIRDSETENYVLTVYEITRTGLNDSFVATYEIEYVND